MLMKDISIVMRRLCTYAEHAFEEQDVGFPEQLIIMCLEKNGPSSQDDIASYLEVDKGAIARTVAKLEAKQLVAREVCPDDHRRYQVCLTEQARALTDKMPHVFENWLASVFQGISSEDVETTMRTIEKMAANSIAFTEQRKDVTR